MYHLYPRLPLAVAEDLAQRHASATIATLAGATVISHPAAYFAPTGGNKASEREIQALQQSIRACAFEHGYPEPARADVARSYDVKCGILLFEKLHIHPSEASHLEVWAFLTTVLAPDVVRWRFSGDRTTIERFIGSDRGLRRNAFGRLWWRVYLLQQPQLKQPYKLFDLLVEDDLVQITERNSIAADKVLAAAFCISFLRTLRQYNGLQRRELMREAIKRVRRLLSIISFSALDQPIVEKIMNDILEQTALSFQTAPVDAHRIDM